MATAAVRETKRRGVFRVATHRSATQPTRPKSLGELRDLNRTPSAQIGDAPLLSAADERRLARAIQRGAPQEAQEARRQLIEANTRLVAHIARSYAHLSGRGTLGARGGMDLDDLTQEGMIGLLHATEGYDPRKARFTTYATWWIRQAITRALVERGEVIHAPGYLFYRQRLLHRLADAYEQAEGHAPTALELAAISGLRLEQVEAAQAAETLTRGALVSLDTPLLLADGEGESIGDLLADASVDEEFQQALERADADLLSERTPARTPREPESDSIAALMATFISGPQATDWTRREMQVLTLRHVEGLGLATIARRLGVSRERARQLQRQAETRIIRQRARVRRAMQRGSRSAEQAEQAEQGGRNERQRTY